MYFVVYGNSSVSHALNLIGQLKKGQYMKIPPRQLFAAQIMGTIIGALCNYFMCTSVELKSNADR